MLIDTHCHLDDDKLYPSADEIVSQFGSFNIEKVIDAGSSFASSVRSVELAKKYDNVYSTIGIHPEEAKDRTQEAYDYFVKASEYNKVVAIGEIGLDYYYEFSDRDTQKRVFVEQIELAESLKLPIVLHVRDAFNDTYEILKQNASKLHYGAVLHCYSGSKEMLNQFNKFDIFYSVGGAITFKNYAKFDMLQAIPLDRLMLETDSPYLTPVPYRGKINTPLNVGLVRDKLSEILKINKEEIEVVTSKNAKTIFQRLK